MQVCCRLQPYEALCRGSGHRAFLCGVLGCLTASEVFSKMSLNLARSLSALWQKSVILARLNCTSKVLLFRIYKSTSAISKMAVKKKTKQNSKLCKCARCPEAPCTVSRSKSLAWSLCAGKAKPAQLFCHGQCTPA